MRNDKTGDCGRFELDSRRPFRVGEPVTINMTFTVTGKEIRPGGCLKFGFPNMGWSEPLPPYPRGDHEIYKGDSRQICRYKRRNVSCRVESSGKADLHLSCRGAQNMIGPYKNWSWWLSALVENDSLRKGDQVVITYGDTRFGEPGAMPQSWVERDRLWFTAFADLDGTGNFLQAAGSPVDVSVDAGKLDHLAVTVPSILKDGDSCHVRIALVDTGMNPVSATELSTVKELAVTAGESRMRVDMAGSPIWRGGLEAEFGASISNGARAEAELLTKDGRSLHGLSNPTSIRSDGKGLFWGDLHCHSRYHQYSAELGYGDPGTSPDELLKYAANIAHMDFAALTDGEGALPGNAGWIEGQKAVIDNYVPGRFTTLKGWEIQFGEQGHRNAVYRTTESEENYDHPAFSGISIWGDADETGGMRGVLRYFREKGEPVMLIPHHPMVWMDWDIYDPDLDRLVEIYSCWGSSEAPNNDYWDKASLQGLSVVEALNRGHRLGFVAGSDSHTGFPGRRLADADRYQFVRWKPGLTAVYADGCSREAIFDALHARHCYATTGGRMIVDFSVDGLRMGSEASKDEARETHCVWFKIVGTDHIKSIEIIRNGEAVRNISPGADECEDEWIDDSSDADRADYYYLRVTQFDGERAWASPVWV